MKTQSDLTLMAAIAGLAARRLPAAEPRRPDRTQRPALRLQLSRCLRHLHDHAEEDRADPGGHDGDRRIRKSRWAAIRWSSDRRSIPFWDKITLESPDLRCVRKDRPYSVSIKLVDASDKTIQTIKTQVKSDLDQTVLPTRPLVVGPVYTKNPDVFKADGSIDYGHDDACPA